MTCITLGVAAGDEAGPLGAGAGVPPRPEQTQVAAGSLTRTLHCRDRGGGGLTHMFLNSNQKNT